MVEKGFYEHLLHVTDLDGILGTFGTYRHTYVVSSSTDNIMKKVICHCVGAHAYQDLDPFPLNT